MGTAVVEGELWGARAKTWAERGERTTQPLWVAMLDAAEVCEGTTFLDLGCGSAGSSVLAVERGANVSGFDASPKLLEIARSRLPGVDFRQGEMEELPYEDGAFERVFAANSIQYVGDKARSLAEVRRVMADSGRLVIGMWCEPDRCEMSVVFRALMELAPPPPDAPPSLAVRDNLVELLESNGFQIESEGEAKCPFEFKSVDDCVEVLCSAGIVVGITRKWGESVVEDALRRAVTPLVKQDGTTSFANWFRYMVCA